MLLVGVVSAYVGLWGVTHQYGTREITPESDRLNRPFDTCVCSSWAITPFLVVDKEDGTSQYMQENSIPVWAGPEKTLTTYHLWIFGPRICLIRDYEQQCFLDDFDFRQVIRADYWFPTNKAVSRSRRSGVLCTTPEKGD